MADNQYRALSPRFDLEEEPGDGNDGARQPWVGAFERVLGDQESLAHDRPSRSAAKAVQSTNPVIGAQRINVPDNKESINRSTAPSAASTSTHSSGQTSPALPATTAPLDDSLSARSLPLSLHADANDTTLSRYRTTSSSDSLSGTSLPPSSATSTHNASSYTSSGPASHTQSQSHFKQQQHHFGPVQFNDTDDLQVQAHGPSLVSISIANCLRFEQSYINHAPCIHHVKVSNRNTEQSVVIRLESDLRQGMSFLRRKRSAPKHDFDPVAWPSNSVAWARNGGFVPANLRGWRHVIANLENADSFVLEPGQSTNVYIVLRPVEFVEEAEAYRAKQWQYGSSLSPLPLSLAKFEPSIPGYLSRPDQGLNRPSSPVSTPAAVGDRMNHFGAADSDHDSMSTDVSDPGLASPRSAPELNVGKVPSGKPARALHQAFGLRGSITLSSWALARNDPEEATHESNIDSSSNSAPLSRPASFHSSHVAPSSTGASSVSALRSTPEDRDIQRIRIPIAAQCCRPFIDAAISSMPVPDASQSSVGAIINLDFGDVIVGQSQSQTLTLRNLSEIDCFCQVKLEEADNMLQTPPISLLDADTSQPIPSVWAGDQESSYDPLTLSRLESKRLQISLKPQEPCRDYEQILTITSLHNASNSVRVVIRANMLGTAKDDALAVVSGDYLDFGDCYGGHWTKQLLVLKNNADVLLDVSFGVQKGYEVMFQLAELAPQADEEAQGQDEIPPSSSNSELALSSISEDDRSKFSSFEESSVDHGAEVTPSELAKTPTHRAQVPKDAIPEPPILELSSLVDEDTMGRGRRGSKSDDDGVDASSVASQAGSRDNSPARVPSESVSAEQTPILAGVENAVTLSSRLGRNETPHFNLIDRLHLNRAQSVLSGSEFDQTSVSSVNQDSHLSSSYMSRSVSRGRPTGASLAGDDQTDEGVSVHSEHTALSQDSRLGSYPATSSHAGSISSTRLHRSPAAALSGLRNVEQAQSNQLEELLLRPGAEYRVVVCYRPQRVAWDEEFTGGRLVERTFRVSLDYARARSANTRSKGGRERRTVVCHSRTCTSFISINPKMIDLGEVQVGTRKSANISVTNKSELTARVDLRFVSKVLSMYRDEVAIPALQTIELKVESFPRRVNETYRKQITVANLLNRQGDQIFEVRSQNVDKQRVSFHSLFYRILTPTGSNFIDFGDVNINSTRMRTFTIENVSDKRLALELTAAHSEDVTLYIKVPPADSHEDSQRLEQKPGVGNVSIKYASVEVADATSTSEAVEGKSKPSKAPMKGADLKERFLETISVDSPTSIRAENASWRLAQKHSHFRKKEDGASASTNRKSSGSSKAKVSINLMSALKKGGKGRLTVGYGKAIAFKDRTLISEFEYLDLASGPPVDARRIPAKSKKFALLENIVTGGKPKSLGLTTAKSHAIAEGETKVKTPKSSKTATSKTKEAFPSGRSAPVSEETTHGKSDMDETLKRLPSPLAQEVKAKTSSSKSSGKSQPTSAIRTPGKNVKDAKADSSARVHFSPALTGKRKAPPVLSNAVDVSRMSLDDLLAAVEAQNSTLSTFFLGSPDSEEQFVRTEINLRRELQSSVETGKLIPLEVLQLPARSERQVIAVYHPSGSTRPHVQGNARKQDSRIFMRLIDFDIETVKQSQEFAGMAELESDELPVRDLMLRSNTCRSLLELGQPHINFGHMEKGDSKVRRILIQNRSEWALRYCIRKSGSIASGDIKLSSGRYGVVPGYGKREVEFVFSPSMSGQFQEKLVVENVADRDNDQTVVLKANVRKVPNFAVDPERINFGACSPGKLSTPESFVLSNTTNKPRSFVIAVDPHGLLHQRCLIDVGLSTASDGAVRGTLSKEEEEEIENLSQKLKIAHRKGNDDKVKKYEERLTALGIKPPSLGAPEDEGGEASSGPNSAETPAEPEPKQSEKAKDLKRVSSTVTCSLAPNQSKRLILRVRPAAIQSAIPSNTDDPSDRRTDNKAGIEEVAVPVKVHEVKNQDETKIVLLTALVEFDLPSVAICSAAATPDPFPVDAVVFSPLTD